MAPRILPRRQQRDGHAARTARHRRVGERASPSHVSLECAICGPHAAGGHRRQHETGSHQSMENFCRYIEERHMTTLWGVVPDASIRTTCTAKTYLQTHLNKTTPIHQRSSKSEQNLKDWILGYHSQVPRPACLAVCVEAAVHVWAATQRWASAAAV